MIVGGQRGGPAGSARGMLARLAGAISPGRRQNAVVVVLLAALGVGVYGSHVANGGYYADDWQIAAHYHFAAAPRYTTAVNVERNGTAARSLLAFAKPATDALFGEDSHANLAVGLAIGVLAAALFYFVLRALGIGVPFAAAMAALALVFPWSDATKLWSVSSLNQLAMCAYFAGLLLALRGVRVGGRRGMALHVGSLGLYLAALLTYEAVAVLLLVSGLVYSQGGSRRRARSRWGADVALALPAIVWIGAVSAQPDVPGIRTRLSFLPHFVLQAGRLALRAATPFPLVPLVSLIAGAALVAWLVLVSTQAGKGDRLLARWLRIAGVATVAAVAGAVPFVGYLQPLSAGASNRGNIAYAYPLAALVVAGLVVASAAGLRVARRRAGQVAPVTLGLCVLVGVNYVLQARRDVRAWDRAALWQGRVLAAVDRAVVGRPANANLYVYGYPAIVSPGIPVFAQRWDLNSAVKLAWGRINVGGYPIFGGVRFVCGPAAMYPSAIQGPWDTLHGGYGPSEASPYGLAILVDAVHARSQVIGDQTSCQRATTHLSLAPLAGRPIL